jgi:hypothetical protein
VVMFGSLQPSLQTISGNNIIVVLCLIHCQSERTCISSRSLAALRASWTVIVRTGHTSQTMLCLSLSVASVENGSSLSLTI